MDKLVNDIISNLQKIIKGLDILLEESKYNG